MARRHTHLWAWGTRWWSYGSRGRGQRLPIQARSSRLRRRRANWSVRWLRQSVRRVRPRLSDYDPRRTPGSSRSGKAPTRRAAMVQPKA
jgi:hypothetical protein